LRKSLKLQVIRKKFYKKFSNNIIYIDFRDQIKIFKKIHFDLEDGASLILIQNGFKMQAENFISLCKARYLTTAQNVTQISFEDFEEVSPREYLNRLKKELEPLDLTGPLDEQAGVIAEKLFERASDGQVLLLKMLVFAKINKEFIDWYQGVFWQKMLDVKVRYPARKMIAFVIAQEMIEVSELPEKLHKKIEDFTVNDFYEFELGNWDEEVLSIWFEDKLNIRDLIKENIKLTPENRENLIMVIKSRAHKGTDWIPNTICNNILKLPDVIIERIHNYDLG